MSGKTERKTGKLVPQPHGGAILDGAAPIENHVPGPGRPPSAVKAALRQDFDTRRELLTDIADGVVRVRFAGTCPACGHEADALGPSEVREAIKAAPSFADRLKAMDVIGKYSDLGESKGIDSVLVQRLAEATVPYLADDIDPQALQEAWLGIIAERLA